MNQFRLGGFNILPTIVKNLLIINGIFFLATVVFSKSFGIDLINLLGLHYFKAEDFAPYQFVTYMFMHGGFGHIFFNMFAVWMFGSAIENYWGPKRFLIYYLITGFGAALIHYAVFYFEIRHDLNLINAFLENPNRISFYQIFENVASNDLLNNYNNADAIDFVNHFKSEILNRPVIVGASGAVFGLLLAFGMMFPNSRIYLYFAIPIKAKYFVIGYGLLELFSGVSNTSDNVAHFAHLGGMLFGFILIKMWKIRRLN